jgi:undecaprenyl-diphosphatase
MKNHKIKTIKKLLLAIIISVILFFLIIIGILPKGFLINLDLLINSLIPEISNDFLTTLSKSINFTFDTITIIIASLILSTFLWFKNYKKESLFFSLTILFNALIVFIIKEIIQRPRPLNAVILENSFSFPSGHAATSLVFFGLLIYLIRKNKSWIFREISIWISVFMVILIGFTRIYLRVHWLTDVFGGFVIGLFALMISIALKDIFKLNKKQHENFYKHN